MNPLALIHLRLLDLLFPRRCVGCGQETGVWICTACVSLATSLPGPEKSVEGVEPLVALFDFSQPIVREALHHLKYNAITELADELVRALAASRNGDELAKMLGEAVLVPVPVTRARRKQRGFNQSEELATALGRWLGLPVWNEALKREGRGQTVVGASGSARRRQEHGFAMSGKALPAQYAGKRLILVDDMLTTGATLRECASVLAGAGFERIGGLVVASKV